MKSPIFPHQAPVYQALAETARVFFNSDWRDLPIRPRFSRLITGPTGNGKTFVVSALAAELEIPLYTIVASNWVPLGSAQRGARPTWVDLVEFCHNNVQGMIFVDEVCKLTGWAPWMQCIRTEAFSLLDGRLPDNVAPSSSDSGYDDLDTLNLQLETARNRLRDSFLIVGAGAFQHLWQRKQSPRIGFSSEGIKDDGKLGKTDLSREIPAEVINRFASPILILPPLQESDYVAILQHVISNLDAPLRCRVEKIAKSSIFEAIENGTGCRWIEEAVLQALIEMSAPEHQPNSSVLKACPNLEFGVP